MSQVPVSMCKTSLEDLHALYQISHACYENTTLFTVNLQFRRFRPLFRVNLRFSCPLYYTQRMILRNVVTRYTQFDLEILLYGVSDIDHYRNAVIV